MNYEKTRVIPTVRSDIFEKNKEARFAITEIAPQDLADMLELAPEFAGAAELRANVYVDAGFVAPEELDGRGTELDTNDERSAHFVMFERTAVHSLARVVGNMRLVIKDIDNPAPLPVEEYFPEYFHVAAPLQSAEVSRLIARHEDASTQSQLKWPLFIAGYKHVMEHNKGPVYGLLAPKFVRSLSSEGVPLTPLHEARYIEEINATKQPVEIDILKLGRLIRATGDFGIRAVSGHVSYVDLSKRRGDDK